MAKALLEIFDEGLQAWVIAIGPDGLPIVGDPETGEGWECCCGGGGGGGPCNLTFATRLFPAAGEFCFRCPPPQGYTCCDYGSRYEWERFGESTYTATAPGFSNIRYDRGREKTRVRYSSITQNCQCVYRCLEREAYGTETTNGSTIVVRDINQCGETTERPCGQGTYPGPYPHQADCFPVGRGFLFAAPFVARNIMRDGPPDVSEQCAGSWVEVIEGVATRTTTWAVQFSCNAGSYTSSQLIQHVNGLEERYETNGTYSIVVTRPSYRDCGDLTECNPCNGSGSLTGPGGDSELPTEPGIAEFLRRQRGCVGCGG